MESSLVLMSIKLVLTSTSLPIISSNASFIGELILLIRLVNLGKNCIFASKSNSNLLSLIKSK